ncbi:MAG: CHAT domain-containing protein, partial [Epsilonproteobacteria bacterium]|nr:CHAT domain-containing protein [Campylobacterota bacterium]
EKYLKHSQDITRISHLLRTAWFYNRESPRKALQDSSFSYWLNYKGTLFEYQNILMMVERKTKNEEIKSDIKRLRELTHKLANLEQNSIKRVKVKGYKQQIKLIEEEIRTIQIRLSQKNKEFQGLLGLETISSEEIVSSLAPTQLYIDFVRADNNYYIFTIDSSNQTTFKQISEEDSVLLEANIEKFRVNNQEMVKTIQRENATDDELKLDKNQAKKIKQHLFVQVKPIVENLYNILIKKYLLQELKDKDSMIISPDGMLNFLPFEALHNDKKYLIESYKINYISSGREYIRQSRREYQNTSSKVVIFGTPNFEFGIKNAKDESSPFEKRRFEDLNSSREIKIIQSYYKNVDVYEGNNSTVTNLMKIRNPKILHLSTHGFFHDDKSILNPMRRSGLALTSGNKAEFEGDMSGLVTALKLSSLELYNTELVVLSACETGLGKIRNAEGVIGLPKAFIQAGAKKVIMSLWSVSEQKTATLMEHFYAHVAKGEDYATALRSAKLKMIGEHPFYWSAFIMSGI